MMKYYISTLLAQTTQKIVADESCLIQVMEEYPMTLYSYLIPNMRDMPILVLYRIFKIKFKCRCKKLQFFQKNVSPIIRNIFAKRLFSVNVFSVNLVGRILINLCSSKFYYFLNFWYILDGFYTRRHKNRHFISLNRNFKKGAVFHMNFIFDLVFCLKKRSFYRYGQGLKNCLKSKVKPSKKGSFQS